MSVLLQTQGYDSMCACIDNTPTLQTTVLVIKNSCSGDGTGEVALFCQPFEMETSHIDKGVSQILIHFI